MRTDTGVNMLMSPGFLCGLCLLLLNDFILKQQFHNALTGKISDLAGLFIFPLFLTALFPRLRVSIYIFTAVAFIFWKSPAAQPLIAYWNQLPLPDLSRTVDYSDLFALVVLPLSYFYGPRGAKFTTKPALIYSIAAISLFAFAATQFSHNTDYHNQYYFRFSKEELVARMRLLPTDEMPDRFRKADDFDVEFDSCIARASIRVEEMAGQGIINLKRINYRCPSLPGEDEMREFFEKEFIERLREEPVTRSAKVKYIFGRLPSE